MPTLGETAIGCEPELRIDDNAKWFLIWAGAWLVALAFLLPALI